MNLYTRHYRSKAIALAVIFVTIYSSWSCSSGKKAMERGNYYQSVVSAVDRLRKNPDHKKSSETLRISYPLALEYYEQEITNMKARDDRNKWGGILNSYTRINTMYEEIRRSPGAQRVISNPKNYFDELAQAKENAAEESYQFGLAELEKGTRQGGKNAYQAFSDANGYVNGYKDVNKKLEQAYWAGTLKVLIAPIPVTNARVQLDANFFEDKIHEQLKTQPINEFVRFMTENELNEIDMAPDHVLQLAFDEFTIGEVHTVERQIETSKDSVIVGSANVPGNSARIPTGQSNFSANSGSQNTSSTAGNTVSATGSSTVESSSTGGNSGSGGSTDSSTAGNNSGAQGSSTTNTNTTSNTNTNTVNTNTNTVNTSTNTVNTNTNTTNTNTSGSTNAGDTSPTGTDNSATGGNSSSGNVDATNAAGTSGTQGSSNNASGDSNSQVNSSNSNSNASSTSGATSENTVDSSVSSNTTSSSSSAVNICHNNKSVKVSTKSLISHLNHGDTIYGCDIDKNKKVKVCHFANGKTLEIPSSALKAHLAHGDKLGGCDGSSYDSVKEGNSKSGSNSASVSKDEKSKASSSSDPKDNASKSNDVKTRSDVTGNKGSIGADSTKTSEKASGTKENKKTNSSGNSKKKKNNEPMLLATNGMSAGFMRDYLSSVAEMDTIINVYATVKAKVFIFEKTIVSNGTLDFKIIEAGTRSLVSAEKLSGEHVWMSQWGHFNGDERALTDEQKEIVNLREMPPPSEQEMFMGFTTPIFHQLVSKLRQFYSRY